MATLSTHVLDTATGRPAAAWPSASRAGRRRARAGVTDDDGRVGSLGGAGPRRLRTAVRHRRLRTAGFFPEVVVVFTVADDRHHHVPLLLSPYGYSTYRGS